MADKKYMDFDDIKLQQPLSSVKRTDKTNDTLIIPANFLTTLERFFDAEGIEYKTIENPSLYPQDKIQAELDRFTQLDHVFVMEDPACSSARLMQKLCLRGQSSFTAKQWMQATDSSWTTRELNLKNTTGNI